MKTSSCGLRVVVVSASGCTLKTGPALTEPAPCVENSKAKYTRQEMPDFKACAMRIMRPSNQTPTLATDQRRQLR